MNLYEYFEERPLATGRGGNRKRNVQGRIVPPRHVIDNYRTSDFPYRKTLELEGRTNLVTEGVWPINHNRVDRYFGDPGMARHPMGTDPQNWSPDIHDLARKFRLHHYRRVWNATEARIAVQTVDDVRVALEITEEWHDPSDGVILPSPESPVLASHSVPIVQYDAAQDLFLFPNSWGKHWGHDGWGAFPAPLLDRYLVESWSLIARGIEPQLDATNGLVCLLWKSACGDGVHGREIVDAATGERIAWAFMVRRDSYLDVEELFVWPSHRMQGFGKKLTELIRELASQMGITVRAWIPFADAISENRAALISTMKLLGLNLHQSPNRSAAFLALPEVVNVTSEPTFPQRPASMRDNLRPDAAPRLYQVWFGTNRKPIDLNDLSRGFTGERDEQVHYGTCSVVVPKSHRFGSIGSSWWARWRRWEDDRLQVVERIGMAGPEFWRQLAATISDYESNERQGLVFLHGYNVNFDAAAIRAAQIGFDLKVPGVTAFFSWPSCGTLSGYPADESCIEASEPFIADFLHDFVTRSGVDRVHLIAHSMGNRGLLRALQRLGSRLSTARAIPFGQIILAAPDIDAQVFSGLASLYPQFAERTTLYASPADRAVALSQWLHQYPRAGLTPPVTIADGIDTVQVPQFDIFELLGHGYFAEAEALLHDIFDLIRRNPPPSDRQRLSSAQTPSGQQYWVMSQ